MEAPNSQAPADKLLLQGRQPYAVAFLCESLNGQDPIVNVIRFLQEMFSVWLCLLSGSPTYVYVFLVSGLSDILVQTWQCITLSRLLNGTFGFGGWLKTLCVQPFRSPERLLQASAWLAIHSSNNTHHA